MAPIRVVVDEFSGFNLVLEARLLPNRRSIPLLITASNFKDKLGALSGITGINGDFELFMRLNQALRFVTGFHWVFFKWWVKR